MDRKRFIIAGLLLLTGAAVVMTAQTMSTYCNAPPFVGGKNSIVTPYVLICQDFTGSMEYETENGSYGYANPNYEYYRVLVGTRNYFKRWTAGPDFHRSGRWVDSLFTTRVDVARKALTGGRGKTIYSKDTLFFQVSKQVNWNGTNRTFYGVITTDSTERGIGVIRQIADLDSDYVWDQGAPRFALMQFSNSAFGRRVYCTWDSSLVRFITRIETSNPDGSTWTGDAVFEAIHYLRYCQNHYANSYTWNVNDVGTYKDNWYEVHGGDTISVSCRPTFVIVVSDGESNSDNPQASCPHLPAPGTSPYGTNTFSNYNGADSSDGTHGCADDYAYWAHIRDIRPDLDLTYGVPDRQSLTFYAIYLYGDGSAGRRLCKNIALYGGFVDRDSSLTPNQQIEYDSDSDGKIDNYFEVSQGGELEQAFHDIFVNIEALTRVTSASAGAITGTTSGLKSGGVTFLSQFYPTLPLATHDLHWIGRTQALWLDPFGWVREDNDNPGSHTLHLRNDHVVSMFFSQASGQSMAARFADTLGTGNDSFFVALDTVPVESLAYLWDAAARLRLADYASRTIYTNLGSGRTDFVTTNPGIDVNLGFGGAARCDSLINFVRGVDYDTTYRQRDYSGTVWKLGDVIYSTPMPVSTPPEAYHLIYGDASYYDFWNNYLNRRNVVYVGANDGMIHAFNSGITEQLANPLTPLRLNPSGVTLGEELWAHIPYNLLPHLKWLMDTSYCHVNFNDLRIYPTDAQIFTPDADHINGWGTLLIGGMRFGGGAITVGGNTYRSAYSCYDVTNPESGTYPAFMWEFKDDSLGYTLCLPVMIKITQSSTTRWFMVTGSGPQNMYGESAQRASIYVVDPANGTVARKITLPAADSNTAITNVFAADWGLNYSVELIYFGTYDKNGGGKIFRINTHEDVNPANWTLHQVINLGKPITAEGSVATDSRGNIWIYYGTGKYFSNVDVGDTTNQLFVGIKDDTTLGTPTNPAFTLADLLDVTNVRVFADSVSGIMGISDFDDLLAAVEARDGWVRRLNTISGERVVTPVLVFAGATVFTTFAPNDTTGAVGGPDLCIGGGGGPQAGNLWALFYLTGTAYKDAILDTMPNGERTTHVSIVGDMPSEPSWYLDKVFVQSAGGWQDYEFKPPYDPFGGVILWRGR